MKKCALCRADIKLDIDYEKELEMEAANAPAEAPPADAPPADAPPADAPYEAAAAE